MTIRRALFWTHLACGILAGIVILIMSATGVLLTYQREITAWYDMRNYMAEPPAGGSRLNIDALASKAATGDGPVTVTLRSDPAAPASVQAGQRTVFVNAYTGEVLGEGAPEVRAFFRRVTDWHRWLGASSEDRDSARMITGASNLLFFIIVVSGPILWLPKKFTWTQVRSIIWFRGGLPPRARDFNWHNTIGIWTVLPLIVIVGSGVVMSYPWANNLVYRVNGEDPPVQGGRGGPGPQANARSGGSGGRGSRSEAVQTVNLDPFIARAEAQRPEWRTIAVRVPAPAQGPIAVTVDEGDGGQPQKRGTLTFDANTGNILKWESQAGATPGRRARSWLRFAHTGEVYGLTGQTIAGFASLGGVVLVGTGFLLAFRRFVNSRLWQGTKSKVFRPAKRPRRNPALDVTTAMLTAQRSSASSGLGDTE